MAEILGVRHGNSQGDYDRPPIGDTTKAADVSIGGLFC